MDLCDVYDTHPAVKKRKKGLEKAGGSAKVTKEPLEILLIKPGDIRHIVKTICQSNRRPTRPIHVSVSSMQILC